jgi:Domain of unknown function (DUF4111)
MRTGSLTKRKRSVLPTNMISMHADAKAQLGLITDTLVQQINGALIGVYLHGSLAMSCFQQSHSDIDVLAVVNKPLNAATKRDVMAEMLNLSGAPYPVDMRLIVEGNLYPWEHPVPFNLSFKESRRRELTSDLTTGQWRDWNALSEWDLDLAADICTAQNRGLTIWGEPLALALPTVPEPDVEDSLVYRLRGMRKTLDERKPFEIALYVLFACRTFAYVMDRETLSKSEAADWGAHQPHGATDVVRQAKAIYEGAPIARFSHDNLGRFINYIDTGLRQFDQ